MSPRLSLRGRGLGRLTLGLGASLGGARDADRYAETQPVFYSTAPFPRSSGLFLIAGYESPPLGPFGLAIDHVGGVSEISATNIAISVSAVAGTTLGVGGYLGSDPAAFYGGLFVYLFSVLDLPALLRRRP